MTKPFTPNDLLRYIYQEMSEGENEKLVQALRVDGSLMQEYLEMLSTIEQLDDLILEPSEKVVKSILRKASLIILISSKYVRFLEGFLYSSPLHEVSYPSCPDFVYLC
jgi:hypothetical protein